MSAQLPGPCGPRYGDGADPLEAHRTGAFDAVLLDRSPLSQPGPLGDRFQFPGSIEEKNYVLSDGAFSLLVPPAYDPERIFVAGHCGGGRVATMLGVDFPDVFAGGFPIVGVTTYLDVPLESNPRQRVLLRFPQPPVQVLDRAREQPLVIMTGSGDFNREQCRLAAEALEEDGFVRIHFLDIEEMGHEMPSADEFAGGLDLLLGPESR